MEPRKDRNEVLTLIANDGSIWETLAYGIKAEHMPEGDTELREAWQKLVDAYHEADRQWEAVSKLIGEL